MRNDLIEELDQAHKEFLAAIEGLGEHRFDNKSLDGKWGVREITAHLAGWLGQLGAGLERMSRGEKPSGPHDWSDVDAWNAKFAEHAKGKRRHEVLHELDHALTAFKRAARKLSEDRYGEGKTANRLFDAAGIAHFRQHAAMIRAWRQSTPVSGGYHVGHA